jgi:cobalamin biosynthesis protein CobW
LEGEHDHDDFDSFVVTCGLVEGDAFRDRLAATIRAHDILRVKGFVAVPGRDRRLIMQAVGDRMQHYFDRPWEPGEPRVTRLVVIGKKGLDRAAIIAELGG